MNNSNQPYYLITGLGKSGLSMAKFLRSKGERVIATDIDTSRADLEKELSDIGVQTQIGFHDQETFDNALYIVPSPGIPLTNKHIAQGLKNGAKLSCELDIFTRYNKLPVIAITGTNGKTTTTTLIGEMLEHSGFKPFVGGNIGTPLVDMLMSDDKYDIVVAEISSFQLDMAEIFKPRVGVLLNISEDHLDRYESFKDYENSKWSLFKNQTDKETAIVNLDIDSFTANTGSLQPQVQSFSSDRKNQGSCQAMVEKDLITFNTDKIGQTVLKGRFSELNGIHNRENIAAAFLACMAAGADFADIEQGLKHFKNLSHRVEYIKTINGVEFYNDSKATNTDAVSRAVQTFEKNLILILGGREKGTDFSLLLNSVRQSVKAVIALGESKHTIKETFQDICTTKIADSMKQAVSIAFNQAEAGDTVLLSPACASFDMYGSYVERGKDFTMAVKELGES